CALPIYGRAAGPLLPLLADGDPAVRMAAAHALGELGDVRAVPPLLRLLGDDELGPSNAAKLALRTLDWRPAGMADFLYHLLATGHIPSSGFAVSAWEPDKVPGILLAAARKGGRA